MNIYGRRSETNVGKGGQVGTTMLQGGVLSMATLKNPVRELRESVDLSVKEFAEQAGVTLETLRMVERGEYLLMSHLVAEKLAMIFPKTTPEKLKAGYAAWQKQVEAEREQRS